MAKPYFRDSLLGERADGSLTPLAGASVTVYEAGTTTPIAATMYDADDVVLLNPLTADAQGTVVFFLDDAQRVDLYVEADGYAASTATVDVVGEDTFSSPSVTGSLTFTDAGSRIVADFSNATVANRLLFQTSTANSATTVGVIPTGSSTQAQASYYNHPTPTSAGALTIGVNGAEARLITSNPGGGEPTSFAIRSALGILQSFVTATGAALFNYVVTVCGLTATPAGGSTAARLLFGTTAGFGVYYGSGLPTVSAAQGSLYLRSDGSSTSTRLYVNTNGTTGWTNVTTAT